MLCCAMLNLRDFVVSQCSAQLRCAQMRLLREMSPDLVIDLGIVTQAKECSLQQICRVRSSAIHCKDCDTKHTKKTDLQL